MISSGTAIAAFVLSLLSVAVSQLLVKARFVAIAESGWPSRRSEIVALIASDLALWVAGALVVLGAAGWYVALTRLPLGVMLPCAAVVSPIVAVASHFLFGEHLDKQAFVAIGMITIGVAWLGFRQA